MENAFNKELVAELCEQIVWREQQAKHMMSEADELLKEADHMRNTYQCLVTGASVEKEAFAMIQKRKVIQGE